MHREARETFEDRSREDQVLKSSQTLSSFVWDQLFTTIGTRSGSDVKQLYERSSLQSPRAGTDSGEFASIPSWAVAHSRRFEEGFQEARQLPAPRSNDFRPHELDRDAGNQLPEWTRPGKKIGPGASGLPDRPPEGYRTLRTGPSPEAVSKAWTFIGNEYGTETPFEQGERSYMARVEPHFGPTKNNPRPHWHKGVTLYEA